MADFSEHDRNTVKEYPLGNALDDVREALRKAEESFESGQNQSDRDTIELTRRKAIMRLLTFLMGHEVALDLRSRTGDRNIAAEVATIVGHVRGGDFNHEDYQALVQLVIKKASDLDIWRAVMDLVTSLSRISPSSVPPSFDGTLVVRSSSSLQCDEQTEKLLNSPLFHEIKHCTYRNVKGFFAKYFEGKPWSTRSLDIYHAVKAQHVDGRWVEFPEPAVQGDVLTWLFQFQKEYLSNAPGVYYTTENTELAGAEARRQLNLFVKRRNNKSGEIHDWNDVLVIGEHKQSTNDLKPMLLQLSRCIRDIYVAQPTRRFVHGFFLHGSIMELWVFDRSGPYSSGEFDIHQEPEYFIRALVGYTLMSDDELGLDNFIQRDGDDHFITVTEDKTGKKTKITLEQKPMVIQRAIICRGTTCFRSKDLERVIKLSWPSDLQPPEAHHLQLARDHGIKGVARLIGHHNITSIKDIRNGLTFPAPYRFRNMSPDTSPCFTRSHASLSRCFGVFHSVSKPNSSLGKRKSGDIQSIPPKRLRFNGQRSKLNNESEVKRNLKHLAESQQDLGQETFKNRLFSCIVISPAGCPISAFSSIVELLTALRDAVKAHQSLFEDAKILHRDISENNIIITNPKTADGFTGMLIDLDLAIVGGERSGEGHMTGTMEFMAIDVLRGVKHTYRHDLESFFYVLLWTCARRAWEREFHCRLKDQPKESMLSEWYGNRIKKVADAKRGSMHADGFKDILKEFPPAFDSVKPLCMKIWSILFPLTKDGELDLSTKPDPRDLYDPIINAFEVAIAHVAVEGK